MSGRTHTHQHTPTCKKLLKSRQNELFLWTENEMPKRYSLRDFKDERNDMKRKEKEVYHRQHQY